MKSGPYRVPQERPGQAHGTQAGLVFAQNIGSQSGEASPNEVLIFSDVELWYCIMQNDGMTE